MEKQLTKEEAVALLPEYTRKWGRLIQDGNRTVRNEGWIFQDMWECYIVYDDGHVSNLSY